MKKIYIFILLLASSSLLYSLGDTTTVSSYYSEISDDMTGEALESALNDLINNSVSVDYDDLDDYYIYTDSYDNGEVIAYYTGDSTEYTYNGFSGSINREHVWPQSRFNLGTSLVTSPYADLFMVRPASASLNSSRNDSYFDYVDSPPFYDAYGNVWSGDVFEPSDAFKGDVARSLFYVATRYGYDLADGTTFGSYQMGNLSTLIEWHLMYPVNDLELERQETVESIQGNRNPYIDDASYVCKVFGDYNDATRSACANTTEVTNLSYDITLNKGNGEILEYTVTDRSFVFPENDYIIDGKTFIGWQLVDGTDSIYEPGDSYDFVANDLVYEAYYRDTPAADNEYTFTFESKMYSAAVETQNLNGVDWDLNYTFDENDTKHIDYNGTKGVVFGSSTRPAEEVSLSTSYFNEMLITGVEVEASGAASVVADISVWINGSQIGSTYSLTGTNTAYSFIDSVVCDTDDNNLEIFINNNSAKAIYIKKITVYYSEAITHSVTYVSENSPDVTYSVLDGLYALDYEADVDEDQVFLGWYTDSSYTTLYDFSQKIYEDVVLYGLYRDKTASEKFTEIELAKSLNISYSLKSNDSYDFYSLELRFQTVMSVDLYDSLVEANDGKSVEFGTIYTTLANFNSFGAASYQDASVYFSNLANEMGAYTTINKPVLVDGVYQFSTVFENIPVDGDLVVAHYVIIDGTTYFTQTSVASVKTVASVYILDYSIVAEVKEHLDVLTYLAE